MLDKGCQSFFNKSINLLCILDKSGNFIALNDAFVLTFGKSREAFYGQSFISLISPAEAENANKMIRNLTSFTSDEDYSQELRCRTSSGHYISVLWNCIPDAETGNFYITGTDITQIRPHEALLNEALNTSKVGGWELDVQTNQYFWTKEVYNIFGLPYNTPIIRGIGMDHIHNEDRAKIISAMDAAISQKKPFEHELRFINSQGDRKWVRSIGKPVIENGKVVKLHGTFQDITSQKETEEAIRESERRLKEAQRLAKLSSWEYDFENETMIWSDETFHQLGFDPKKGVPSNEEYLQMIHPEDTDILLTSIENAMKGGVPYEVELRYISPSGEIRHAKTKGIPVYENNRLKKLVGISLDITDQKMTEQELVSVRDKRMQLISNLKNDKRKQANA